MKRSRSKRKAPWSGSERGQALVMFILALGVLFGMTAMAIDVGSFLRQKSDLQKTADAASLAGAVELPDSAVLADSKAREWAQKNGIDVDEGDELVVSVSPDQNSVTVEVTREAPFIFGRVLGFSTVDIRASATAKVGSPLNLAGILPFGVLQSAVTESLNDGSPVTLKYDASDPRAGNFGPIVVDGTGSNIHEQSIMYGTNNSVCALSQGSDCPDPTVGTQTGNMVGATRDGFNYRFNNTGSGCDEFSEVLISRDDGTYNVNGSCNPFGGSTDSMRLAMVPVIDEFPPGASGPVTIQYFLAVYLNSFSKSKCIGISCEVTGTFVKIVADPANDATLGIYEEGSGVKFVRLVE